MERMKLDELFKSLGQVEIKIDNTIVKFLDTLDDTTPVMEYLWKHSRQEMIEWVRDRMTQSELVDFVNQTVGSSIKWLPYEK